MINVQTTYSDINLGGQGMVITNQGVAIQPCFQQAKHMQFLGGPHSLARNNARRRVFPHSHRDLRRTQTNTPSRKETHIL